MYFTMYKQWFAHSGNSGIEAAINWVAEHEDDPDIDQMPLVVSCYFLPLWSISSTIFYLKMVS